MKVEYITDEPGGLNITGEIDYHSAGQLREHMNRMQQKQQGDITLKLDGVEFIDSTGLSVLLDAVKTAQAQGGMVTLVQPSRQLVRVLNVSGFAPYFKMVYDGHKPILAEPQQRIADDGLRMESFEAEGKPENIGALRRSVVRFAKELPLTKQELDDIKLAVGEATCNALRYGCPTGNESIHVTCTRRGDRFSVQINDSGPGFNPDTVPQVTEGELTEGGRGIFFMKCLMDEVNFRFSNGTTVELVKYISEPSEAEEEIAVQSLTNNKP